MKLKPLILFLLICSSVAAQNTFNWNDNVFKTGEWKMVHVEYELDKARLNDTNRSSLDTLVTFLKKNSYLKIEVQYFGYGPVKGRVNSVARYLMSKGIDSLRIKANPTFHAVSFTITGDTVYKGTSKQRPKEMPHFVEIEITSTCYKHETFNYTDSVFYDGSRRRVKVEFGMDAGELLETSKVVIDSVVTFMNNHPTFKIEIANHTDPRGSAAHNMVLSQMRAQSVLNYIVGRGGIDSARVTAKGYGSAQPLPGCSAQEIALMKTPQEKEKAWQSDRRTEVVILEK